jgi:hypothetical protein
MEEQQNPTQSASILDNSPVAAGPGEEVIIRKPRAKKKRTGDWLRVESQIKRRDAIKGLVKSFLPIVQQAKARNANESDTANIVHKFFQDVLGWDFMDLTSEYKIKNTFCDLAVKLNGEIKLLIEVKAIGLNLKEEHLRQASAYAAHEGVHFVALTNGEVYRVYHVGFGDKITVAMVAEIDLAGELQLEDYTELYLLSKHSLPKLQIEEYWAQEEALCRENMLEALESDDVITALGKYFRSQYDLKVDPTTLRTKVQGLF